MKNLVLFAFLCFTKMTFAHNVTDNGIPKHWTIVQNSVAQKFDGYFYLYKDGKVFIEKENHALIALPLAAFAENDQRFVLKKYQKIQYLNAKIAIANTLAAANKNAQTPVYGFETKALTSTDPLVIDAAFAPFKPTIYTRWDATYFYVESKGIPTTHTMMQGITGWQQQFPIPQCYVGANAWSIPLNPVMAATPVPVNSSHFLRGAIALAVNGIPIFNPYTNTGVDAFLDGQLDTYGGHCGRADDYHYHIAPLHLYGTTAATLPIAYALDGFAVYGTTEPEGGAMTALDANHGHTGASGVYHYHGSATAPYMIGKMVGQVTEDATLQIIPQAAAQPLRPAGAPLPGAVITSCLPNATNNGYSLVYTKAGLTYSVQYSWTTGGVFTFNFISPTGTTTSTYNSHAICNVTVHSEANAGLENKITVFPNPASDVFYINLKDANIEKSVKSTAIYSINGRKAVEYQGFNGTLDTKNLAKGVYFIKIETDKGFFTKKVVVQ